MNVAAPVRSRGAVGAATQATGRQILDIAVLAAKAKMLDLVGLMFAHGLDFKELPLLLSVPPAVARAYEEWAKTMNEVTRLIARQESIPHGAFLTEADRAGLTARAFEMVMD